MNLNIDFKYQKTVKTVGIVEDVHDDTSLSSSG